MAAVLTPFEQLEPRLLLDGALPGQAGANDVFQASPALFIENQGQWADASIRYGFHGAGANILFKDGGPVFQVFQLDDSDVTRADQFSVGFDGANAISPTGWAPAPTVFNYYVGGAAAAENVPAYTAIGYEELYDGIDLVSWGRRDGLKYEFHVAPGADPGDIVVRYDGIDGLSLGDDGRLVVHTALGDLTDDAPYIFQEVGSERVEVSGSFALLDSGAYTFDITGPYDAGSELIIDPDLVWWGFLGGDGNERGADIEADAAGNSLVIGRTNSADFASELPGLDGADKTYNGGSFDTFVARISTDGTAVDWWTYLGGNGNDEGFDIEVDAAGNAFVTGITNSGDFAAESPLAVGFDQSYNGGANDVFAARLAGADGALDWWTYLGGIGDDAAPALELDPAGDVLVAGHTNSGDFAAEAVAPDGADQTYNGGDFDAFAVKLTGAAGALDWWTYLGGSGIDRDPDIALDSGGNPMLTGSTSSRNFASEFPGLDGADQTYNGGSFDVFVARLMAADGDLDWWTYLGGSGNDEGLALGIDGADDPLLTGLTNSGNFASEFPAAGGFDVTHNDGDDAFISKLAAADGGLTWWTYVGGRGTESGRDIAVDGAGNAVITGSTSSTDFINEFPAAGGFNVTYNGGTDVFIVKAMAADGALDWGTLLGGRGSELEPAIELDADANVLVTGYTNSRDFASEIPGALGFDHTYNGGDGDIFAAKVSEDGATLDWWAYLGGNGRDQGTALAVDATGDVLLTGYTNSSNFASEVPGLPGFDQTYNGAEDAFVAKITGIERSRNVTGFRAVAGDAQVGLDWTNPTDPDVVGIIIVRRAGAPPAVGPTDGVAYPVASPLGGGTVIYNDIGEVFIDNGVVNGITYHYDAWSYDATLTYSPAPAPNASATPAAGLDADGDALLDLWETLGIDVDGDGTIDLDLPALGADPMHKDVFIEVDAMDGRAPTTATLDMVVAAFAAAPDALVGNPDGVDGITLHIERDETSIPLAAWPAAWADFDAVKAARFGTAAQRVDADALAAKRLVYRYCVFADTHGGTTSSGSAEVGGNDFFVTLGGWLTPGGTPEEQAGTFMHELGHSLGLLHGGGDDVNCKPNYRSVMNYTWQAPISSLTSQWMLDYSRDQLPDLDEANLDEAVGIGGTPGRMTQAGPLPREIVGESGPVDWSRDDADFDGDPDNDVGVAADINRVLAAQPPSPGEVLAGAEDWSNLAYDFRTSPDFADGVHGTVPVGPDLTQEVALELGNDLGTLPAKFNKKRGWQPVSAAFPGRIWFKINRNGKFKFKLKALGKALARRITVALLDEFGVPAAGVTIKAKKLSVKIKAKSLAAGRYYLDLTTLFPTAVTYDAKFSYKTK